MRGQHEGMSKERRLYGLLQRKEQTRNLVHIMFHNYCVKPLELTSTAFRSLTQPSRHTFSSARSRHTRSSSSACGGCGSSFSRSGGTGSCSSCRSSSPCSACLSSCPITPEKS